MLFCELHFKIFQPCKHAPTLTFISDVIQYLKHMHEPVKLWLITKQRHSFEIWKIFWCRREWYSKSTVVTAGIGVLFRLLALFTCLCCLFVNVGIEICNTLFWDGGLVFKSESVDCITSMQLLLLVFYWPCWRYLFKDASVCSPTRRTFIIWKTLKYKVAYSVLCYRTCLRDMEK